MKKSREFDELQELVKSSNKANQNRNYVLTLTVALIVVVLFSTFSIAKGKVIVDSIKNLREKGSIASAFLENAEEKQYIQLKELDYIKYIGKQFTLGNWEEKEEILAVCEVLDKTGYEKLVKPAYDEIKGEYPVKKNEIMVSKKLLKKLGIKPELGMKISVPIQFNSWSLNDGSVLEEDFVLSGYYNDYREESEYVPVVYLSEKYLEYREIPRYPVKLLISFKSSFFSNSYMEKQLYEDVALINEMQQFVAYNSVGFQTINQFIGGYAIAMLCALIVLLSAYLLIYNVLSISLNRDMQYYGLLFTIGLTQKQLKKITFRQNRKILMNGIGGGVAISFLVGIIAFPKLFQGLFLEQKGTISIKTILYPEVIVGVVLIVILIVLIASEYTIKKLKKLSPIEAFKYGTVKEKTCGKRNSLKGAAIRRMAWYNLFRSKRKFFITIISLFLGCEVALLTVFISNGTEIMNELLQKPDFRIGTQKEAVDAYLFPFRKVKQLQVDRTQGLFDETFVKEIMKIEGINEESLKEIYGCYGSYNFVDEFVQPLEGAAFATGTSNTSMTIQVVDEQYIDRLESYVIAKKIDTDIESLRDGNGILVLHNHELSELLELEASEIVGEPAQVYSMDGEGDPEDEGVEFVCSGYLDTTLQDFPKLDLSWNGGGINYFVVSQLGYERLNYPKQLFAITIDAEKGKEELVKARMTELIQEKNGVEEMAGIYYLSSTSDEVAKKKNYVDNSKTVMFALCLSLFLLGITNYINVIITNMISRNKEFAIMQSIGMTKKQLRRMLILEGLFYWLILEVMLISLGTLLISGVGTLIGKNLSYFKFIYPVKEFWVIASVLLFFCVLIPQIVYKKMAKNSPVEELGNDFN